MCPPLRRCLSFGPLMCSLLMLLSCLKQVAKFSALGRLFTFEFRARLSLFLFTHFFLTYPTFFSLFIHSSFLSDWAVDFASSLRVSFVFFLLVLLGSKVYPTRVVFRMRSLILLIPPLFSFFFPLSFPCSRYASYSKPIIIRTRTDLTALVYPADSTLRTRRVFIHRASWHFWPRQDDVALSTSTSTSSVLHQQ